MGFSPRQLRKSKTLGCSLLLNSLHYQMVCLSTSAVNRDVMMSTNGSNGHLRPYPYSFSMTNNTSNKGG